MYRSLTLITSLIVMTTTAILGAQQPPSTEPAKAQAKGETRTPTSPKMKGDEPAIGCVLTAKTWRTRPQPV
jgi:hypothetical protein